MSTCVKLLPQLLPGEGIEPPRAAIERCSCASRCAAVGRLGIPSGPRTCPLPEPGLCSALGNACSRAGRIAGPCPIARGHDVVAPSEAEAARWATISVCILGSVSLEAGGSVGEPCDKRGM